ncbi:YlmC/YmxH family sporulation protein [Oscillospiraceae bacterium MB08-C2-2]|nr:YlmC/YmxH family sporulation protein [Oscillospiraceae bacterium MB08-C2-2]
MNCRITDLRYKEVINVRDGSCLGFVSDIEVDTVTAKVVSLIIFGRCRLFGLFFRGEDIIIPWCNIEVIGEDTILINMEGGVVGRRKRNGFFSGFGN